MLILQLIDLFFHFLVLLSQTCDGSDLLQGFFVFFFKLILFLDAFLVFFLQLVEFLWEIFKDAFPFLGLVFRSFQSVLTRVKGLRLTDWFALFEKFCDLFVSEIKFGTHILHDFLLFLELLNQVIRFLLIFSVMRRSQTNFVQWRSELIKSERVIFQLSLGTLLFSNYFCLNWKGMLPEVFEITLLIFQAVQ